MTQPQPRPIRPASASRRPARRPCRRLPCFAAAAVLPMLLCIFSPRHAGAATVNEAPSPPGALLVDEAPSPSGAPPADAATKQSEPPSQSGAPPVEAAVSQAGSDAPSGAGAAKTPSQADTTKSPNQPGSENSRPAAAPAAMPDPEALARAYRVTGDAALVQVGDRGAAVLVPFGHGRPVLRCAPLRACALELEPGELVLATSLGDGERWLVQSAAAGPGAQTPLLVVKPTACDLSTNLVVATDRRIYELALDSPPCRGADAGESGAYNPRLPYTGLVRFYYPDDLVRRWIDQERLARRQAAELAAGHTPLAPAARLAQLNFDYSWDRARRWPWVPSQVFDDGEHTYLVLPPAARLAELPILLGVEPGGGLALLTYHLEGQTLVADRVLERAVLVVGHGKPRDEQRLEILNRAFGKRGGGDGNQAGRSGSQASQSGRSGS